ncbi:hypothetical protein B0H17DRAFT_1072752 [Mycena rosella]|uniref:Uncharacterized protein n=1 Tax=Mycena rosella TaxID=1033263 RepID=A0AAD7D9R6_MYCRO|nr:hypothetical protein B0H17DRAFT_1072752 [Mycena rosella]
MLGPVQGGVAVCVSVCMCGVLVDCTCLLALVCRGPASLPAVLPLSPSAQPVPDSAHPRRSSLLWSQPPTIVPSPCLIVPSDPQILPQVVS